MDLVHRFEHAARRLDNLQRGEFTSLELGTASTTDGTTAQAVALRKARTEFDSARDAIRGTPGLAAFLGPPSWSDIAQATENSPLVYLSCEYRRGTRDRCPQRPGRNIPAPRPDLQQLNDRLQIYAEAYSGPGSRPASLAPSARGDNQMAVGRSDGPGSRLPGRRGPRRPHPLRSARCTSGSTPPGRWITPRRPGGSTQWTGSSSTYAPSALALRSAVRSQPVAGGKRCWSWTTRGGLTCPASTTQRPRYGTSPLASPRRQCSPAASARTTCSRLCPSRRYCTSYVTDAPTLLHPWRAPSSWPSSPCGLPTSCRRSPRHAARRALRLRDSICRNHSSRTSRPAFRPGCSRRNTRRCRRDVGDPRPECDDAHGPLLRTLAQRRTIPGRGTAGGAEMGA